MARIAHFVAIVLATGLAGCTGKPTPPATGPSADPGSAVVSPSSPDDPPGRITCRDLATGIRNASLMEPGVVRAVVTAADTADAPVADAATALGEAYENALASQGTQGEPDAVAAVSAAAADMSQVCADSGLDSAN